MVLYVSEEVDAMLWPKPESLEGISDMEIGEVTVEWEVQIESREWGIKDIGAFIRRVHGTITMIRADGEGEEEVELNAESPEWEFEPSTVHISERYGFYPIEAEIDLKNKKIKVDFQIG